MKQEIRISKKIVRKGEDGHKVVSVRMKDETMARLDELSAQTNRSRNELINILLESALDIITIIAEDK
ncbi:MAG: ribbon-helix-helix protein, CopG family [Clostridia bacterium]|nr:ribbon-helix-helix protein, CopG family [Clostridia bacterium]